MDSLSRPHWDIFQDSCVGDILSTGGKVKDIGGGLRISQGKSNRFDPIQYEKYSKYFRNKSLNYVVTDYTDTYGPDEIQDIHNLGYPDESIDGIFCLAVLEHINNPQRAAEEMLRVLKKGGKIYAYAPFLYKYHAHEGYYSDYYRYTYDGLMHLFRAARKVELAPVRGILETTLKITPLYKYRLCKYVCRYLDMKILKLRELSKYQTSGYNIYVQK